MVDIMAHVHCMLDT